MEKTLLENRYIFYLVDKLLKVTPGPSGLEGRIGVARMGVSGNEDMFFGLPLNSRFLPGLLIVEALTQVLILSTFVFKGDKIPKQAYLVNIKRAELKKTICPGEQLVLENTICKVRLPFFYCKGLARLGERVVLEAEFTSRMLFKEELSKGAQFEKNPVLTN